MNEERVRPSKMRNTEGTSRLLVGIAAALALLYLLRSIVVPLFVALLLTALIDGVAHGLKRFSPKAPHWALFMVAAAIVITLLGGCVTLLVFGGSHVVSDAPALARRIEEVIAEICRASGIPRSRLDGFFDEEAVMSLVTSAVSSIGNLAAGSTLAVLYLGFIFASRQNFAKKIASLMRTPAGAAHLLTVLDRIGWSAGTYMWVQTVTGAAYAIASGVVLYLIGLDNVPFWTILIFLLSYVPVLGVAVASTLLALFALLQFPTYWQAIAAFATVQIFAFLVGNILLPRMQADSQNIDPAVAVFAVALWALLWGVAGAFLAVPLTVMMMIVFAQFKQCRWAAVLISNDGVPEGDASVGQVFGLKTREAPVSA